MVPAKLKRLCWGGIWKRRPSHCTTFVVADGAFVQEAEQGEFGAANFQRAVEAAVEQKHLALDERGRDHADDERGTTLTGEPRPLLRSRRRKSPLMQDEITATRCNSFWLKRNVSRFIG